MWWFLKPTMLKLSMKKIKTEVAMPMRTTPALLNKLEENDVSLSALVCFTYSTHSLTTSCHRIQFSSLLKNVAAAKTVAKAKNKRALATKKGSKKQKSAPKKGAKTGPKATLTYAEVYSGPPTEKLDGGWPEGWTKKAFERQGTSSTDGRKDNYWYTPKKNYKLRSLPEVKRVMAALIETRGDETQAQKLRKVKKPKAPKAP